MTVDSLSGLDKLRGLTFLERIVRSIAVSSDASAVMESIVKETTEATGSQVCSLYIWDPEKECLTLSATNGLPQEAVGLVNLRLGEGITGWVGESREPLAVEDVREDPRFYWVPNVDNGQYTSMLSVPVMLGERLLGVLNIQTADRHPFTSSETDFLAAIAAHLAGVIEISGLHRQLGLARALQASEERYRCIVETTWEGILTLDESGTVVYVNQRLCDILGYDASELYGCPFDGLHLGISLGDLRQFVGRRSAVFGGQFDARVQCRDGSNRWVIVSASPIDDSSGNGTETLVMLTDITERKQAEEALKYEALHDHLTGLPNRTLFEDRLDLALRAAERSRRPASVLLLDLDGFKEVNDSVGHAAGDILLGEIGPRLRGILRGSDTLARLGGDEFVVLLPTTNLSAATTVAEKILAALEQPFVVDGHAMYVGASIGVVTYPEHGKDVETLLRHADIAMYAAKRDRGMAAAFSGNHDPAGDRLILAAGLRGAIGSPQLELHYQPKLALGTSEIIGVEALMRWRHPERGYVPPLEFIPIAERTGLIGPLGLWSLKAAVDQCRLWLDSGIALHVAVNLSMRNLRDPKLPAELMRMLEESALDPNHLKLEVTESMLMTESDGTVEALSRMKAMGIQISIDDFGTGYSSLWRLARLPVDELKIDKSFVLGMMESKGNAAIVRSTIDLAHNLGLTVVAEGVESREVLDHLVQWGCDEAQGYYISRPMAANTFEHWLQLRSTTLAVPPRIKTSGSPLAGHADRS